MGVARARNGARACCPASLAPAYAITPMTTIWLWCSSGTNGIGGAGMTFAIVESSSGAACAVRHRGMEEGIHGSPIRGIESDMCGRRRRLSDVDREVVQPFGSVSDAVRLDVELFEPEWSERRRVETPAGFEVADHEQDVIDDHPSGRHAFKRSWWPRDRGGPPPPPPPGDLRA